MYVFIMQELFWARQTRFYPPFSVVSLDLGALPRCGGISSSPAVTISGGIPCAASRHASPCERQGAGGRAESLHHGGSVPDQLRAEAATPADGVIAEPVARSVERLVDPVVLGGAAAGEVALDQAPGGAGKQWSNSAELNYRARSGGPDGRGVLRQRRCAPSRSRGSPGVSAGPSAWSLN